MSSIDYKGKVFLITGGLGFIGGHLAKWLLSKGAEVYIIDNKLMTPRKNSRQAYNMNMLLNLGINYGHLLVGDISNISEIRARRTRIPNEIFCTIHLAAHTGVSRDGKISGGDYFATNINGTKNIVDIFAPMSTHFINFSSSNVYGDNKDYYISENSETNPINAYGVSKLEAEGYCKEFIESEDTGLLKSLITLRPFNIYGPNYKNGAAIYEFAKNILRNMACNIYNLGESIRTYIYVDDVVNMVDKVLCYMDDSSNFINKRSTPIYDVFNIGGSIKNTISTNNLVEMVYAKISSKITRDLLPLRTIYCKSEVDEISRSIPDMTKAKFLLGEMSSIALDDGLDIYIDWVISNESKS